METLHIDGQEFPARREQNLLQFCLSHGFNLPYFCWHPALGSVGACRQCAVLQFANPEDSVGRIVMACMTPAAPGTRISLADPQAQTFRASVIEWLMTNHPHDCPVCEEGGECHLQDMTVMTGHSVRRYRFTKRTHRNQYLGPFIKHEMNRCIACYRCVRFYRDYAGGTDLDVQGAHNNVYFGRDRDGVLESDFSGNLVEVCPTGVFTDKTLSAAYNRKWDLRSLPSVCVHCGHGCNTSVSERAGNLRRILNRFNGAVNGYFLCDRGRFGYGFANAASRPRNPLWRPREGAPQPMPPIEAMAKLAELRGTGRILGIGSPRASLEANFALRAFTGADAFYPGFSAPQAACLQTIRAALHSGVHSSDLAELEAADAILVLGEDICATAPRLALALRQAAIGRAQAIAEPLKIPLWQAEAVREAAGGRLHPLFIATPHATALDPLAARLTRAAPDDIARLAFAIWHALDASAPAVPDLPAETQSLVQHIAATLAAAQRPLLVAGCELGQPAILRAATGIAHALKRDAHPPAIAFAVPECNSLGLALMQGGSVQDALAAAATGDIAAVIVLENDLYRRADGAEVDALFASTPVIVLDHIATATTAKAGLLLPVPNFAESHGTYVNAEGRAQRAFQLLPPGEGTRPTWTWLQNGTAPPPHFDALTAALAAELPVFAGIRNAAPRSDFRIASSRIASAPHRYSGRTAMDADHAIQEPKADWSEDSPFSATMEGYYGPMPPALIPFFWAPGWNSGQSLHKFQDESGALRGGNPGVRLFTPNGAHPPPDPGTIPAAFTRHPERWLIVPHAQVFGAEEMSALAPPIAERISAPTLSLNMGDAAALGLEPGGWVDITLNSGRLRLPVTLAPELPPGIAAMSVGLPATPWAALPAWATLRRAPCP